MNRMTFGVVRRTNWPRGKVIFMFQTQNLWGSSSHDPEIRGRGRAVECCVSQQCWHVGGSFRRCWVLAACFTHRDPYVSTVGCDPNSAQPLRAIVKIVFTTPSQGGHPSARDRTGAARARVYDRESLAAGDVGIWGLDRYVLDQCGIVRQRQEPTACPARSVAHDGRLLSGTVVLLLTTKLDTVWIILGATMFHWRRRSSI
jgi:hypothetical protein